MLQETQSTQDDDELLLNLVISEIQSDPDPGIILQKKKKKKLIFVFRIKWCT
jgi:hypothetical protein